MGKNCGTHVWFLKLTYMFHRIPACAVFYIKKCKLQKKTNFRRKLTFLKYSFKTKIRIQFDGTNGNWSHYVTEISWFHTFLLSEFPWFKNICLLLFLPGRLHLEASVCQTNRDRLRYSPSVSACTYKQKFVFFKCLWSQEGYKCSLRMYFFKRCDQSCSLQASLIREVTQMLLDFLKPHGLNMNLPVNVWVEICFHYWISEKYWLKSKSLVCEQ